jgi:hypothetical protein
MDDKQFDALARSLAQATSRRNVLRGLLSGLAGGAALRGTGRSFAQESEEEILDQPTETTEAPSLEEPPPDPPVEEPPAEEPPADPPTDIPAEEPAPESLVETAEDGTPVTDTTEQPPVDCGEGTPCEDGCCPPGTRCCGVYCIEERDGSCCADSECSVCEVCGLDGVCYAPCAQELGLQCCVDEERQIWTCGECCRDDPECFDFVDCEFCESLGPDVQCCVDEKHHTVTCAFCCDDGDCASSGACHVCHGGYCLSCGDQTDGRAQRCALECNGGVSATDEKGSFCVQCCYDVDCGPCQRCHDGWCEYVCDEHEFCCRSDVENSENNGGYCAECCTHENCGHCEECVEGYCRSLCDDWEVCCDNGLEPYCRDKDIGCCGGPGDWCVYDVSLSSGERLDGYCCDNLRCCFDEKSESGTCAECCEHDDCREGLRCCGGYCAECCKHKDCPYGHVCVEGVCSECRDNHDCGKDAICCDGTCYTGYECCFENAPDPVNCGECETCFEGFCQPTGVGLYGICNPMYVSAAEGTPQLNCCDGLVCCDTKKHGLICLECCGDHDCAHGCECVEGFCSCACSSDKDCEKGACCCNNGSCSADCCHKPDDKPGKPGYESPSGGVYVESLPSTGSGDSAAGSGMFGALALGAAAYLAAKKLREQGSELEPAED